MSSSTYEKGSAWCSSVNGELRTRHRALVVHSDQKPGPGSEVFAPVRDSTERTNYVQLFGSIAQVIASAVTTTYVIKHL